MSRKIKYGTVSQRSTDKSFAAILFEIEEFKTNNQGKIAGIDLGVSSLVTGFDGKNCYKGKAVQVVARVYESISHIRPDLFHEKLV